MSKKKSGDPTSLTPKVNPVGKSGVQHPKTFDPKDSPKGNPHPAPGEAALEPKKTS